MNYTVILILTDGAIHDMAETKDQIVRASMLPISIIIIGIGNSQELTKMEELDGDRQGGIFNSIGQKSARDLV